MHAFDDQALEAVIQSYKTLQQSFQSRSNDYALDGPQWSRRVLDKSLRLVKQVEQLVTLVNFGFIHHARRAS